MINNTNRPVNLTVNAVRKFPTPEGERSSWTKIGIAFAHNKADGFGLKLELLPFAGQDIVLMPLEEDQPSARVYQERMTVYAVRTYEREGESKKFFSRLGTAFPNSKGGFNVRLELLPCIGQDILMLPPREEDDAAA